MGKRQKRFTGSSIFEPALMNQKVHVVLKNGTVHHLKVLKSEPETIFAENACRQKIKISSADVFEILMDFESAY